MRATRSPPPTSPNAPRFSPGARAFTLIDLLLALGVLLLALSAALPGVVLLRHAAAATACRDNLRLLTQGLHAYAADHDGALPGDGWHDALCARLALAPASRLARCPEARQVGIAGPGYAMCADFVRAPSDNPDLKPGHRLRLAEVGLLSAKVFLLESDGRDVVLPPYLTTSAFLPGNAGDPSLPHSPDDDNPILRIARHGTLRRSQPLVSYLLNVAFFDGHVETPSILDLMSPTRFSPPNTRLSERARLTYPRVTEYRAGIFP